MEKTAKKDEVKDRIRNFVFEKKERDFDPQTTLNQLMVKKQIVWCWGAKDFKALGSHALVFKVNGYKHKGYVVITLGFMDTYDIHLLDKQGNQKGITLRDVYCDQLTDVIDTLVESN